MTLANLKPPPKLTVSEWSDKNRVLSSETSSSPGKWVTYSFQKPMMDAFSDPLVEQVVIMAGSQLGKTEILLNVLGYHIALDPSPIMIIQPTLSMAGSFSRNRISPLIRDCEALRTKVKDPRARDSGNTVYSKSFIGGSLDLIGSNSPSSASSRPVRLLLMDEVDRYSSATVEGDIIGLAKRRTSNFYNRKIGMVTTPTIKGESRIEEFYLQGDQNKWFVPCPHCGDSQTLEWKGVEFEKINGAIKDAFYVCQGCGSPWSDTERLRAINQGHFKPSAEFTNIRSFHINGLYSPWTTLFEQAVYFNQARGKPETLRIFVNVVLAQTFDENADGESVDAKALQEKAEDFGDELPREVVALTCGVDTQADRLEATIMGADRDEGLYIIDHHVLWGDPNSNPVWKELEELLLFKYKHPSGEDLTVRLTCIDSGGSNTGSVYKWCRTKGESLRAFAIKGVGGERAIISKPTTNNIGKVKLFPIGVDTTKSLLYGRLKIDEGEGAVHISDKLSNEYFEQMCSEKRIEKYSKGTRKHVWIKTRARNEAWDCFQYAYAGLQILNVNLRLLHERMNRPKQDEEKPILKKRPSPINNRKGRWMDT